MAGVFGGDSSDVPRRYWCIDWLQVAVAVVFIFPANRWVVGSPGKSFTFRLGIQVLNYHVWHREFLDCSPDDYFVCCQQVDGASAEVDNSWHADYGP